MTRTTLAILALALPALTLADGHPARSGPTADQAIRLLQEGNARFRSGKASHPEQSLTRVKALAGGQTPFATILGCSDSRVPPELVFDRGFGDLFTVRVAGNVADPVDLGSIEYAAEHLGVPAIVVLGHHGCGAVKATAEAAAHGQAGEGNIGAILAEIAPAVAEAKRAPGKEGLVDDAVHANARRTAAAIVERSAVIRHLVETGKVKIAIGIYDLGTGAIEWL